MTVACLALAISCSSNGASGGGTTHTYADASTEMTALSAGLGVAETNTSGPAYYNYSSNVYTHYFNSYTNSGITINGSLALNMSSSPYTEIGTFNFTGGTVKQIIYNVSINPSTSTMSGTYTIKFTDNTSWTYNLSTHTFTGG